MMFLGVLLVAGMLGAILLGVVCAYIAARDNVKQARDRRCRVCGEKADRVGMIDREATRRNLAELACPEGHTWVGTYIWPPRTPTSGFGVDSYAP